MGSKPELSTRAKVVVTVSALAAVVGAVGAGTYGAWTSTTAVESPTYSSGAVKLDFGPAGATNRLSVGASGLAPGDTVQRGFTLRNNGSLDFASISMDLSAPASSLLDSDPSDGLTLKIEECSTGWIESGSTPYTYSCTGTQNTVLAVTPVATAKATPPTLGGLAALSSGGSDSLRATFALPAGSGDATQGRSSTLSVAFTAVQRAATNH
jgi:spore coat-associated protein N